jgi:YD repeat-containing protein
MIRPTGTVAGYTSGIRQYVRCGAVASLITLCTLARADEITYGYDALGRLTSVSVAGATAYYDYDAAGNITAIRRHGALSSTLPMNIDGPSRASEGAILPASPALAQTRMR